jgi:hypothetical protein
MTLGDYVLKYTARGECQCGKCADKGNRPDPAGLPADAPPEERVSDILSETGHTADLMFFKVAKKDGATAEEFIRLTKANRGTFGESDLFDGEEHNFMEVGAWIGDQGMALRYMGLGNLLGVFDLLTPRSVLGKFIDDKMAMELAGQGMVTVAFKKAKKVKPCPK